MSADFLKDIFKQLDKDGSGFISADELQEALSNGSWSAFNPETIRLMIGMFDRDKRGHVSYENFGALWNYVTDWQKCFRNYDLDNSNSIDRQELQTALTSFGYKLSAELLDTLIKKFDRIGAGHVLFDDFIQCCIVLQTLTTAFKAHDKDMKGVITIDYEQFLDMVFSLTI
ncbi:CG17765 [Drosophila busckii]|uniref:CG17765 n=1 Tax=Drosophila busckii TaxID=30019 RepID=A0A0M3QVI0_DROBS|nr:programmed cell death protein 6-like [Drosophila busckii]ALC42449.1 CG17765 [Drosophila busckii]